MTEEGKSIAEQKAEMNQTAWKKIETAVAQFKQAGEIDYMKMSVAAKTFFMLSSSGNSATETELSESAKALGWSPKPQEIAESIGFLKKLGLVGTMDTK